MPYCKGPETMGELFCQINRMKTVTMHGNLMLGEIKVAVKAEESVNIVNVIVTKLFIRKWS